MRLQLATLGLVLGFVCATPAAASPVTWQWSGPVTGYRCRSVEFGCDVNPFATVVPLGTTVDVFLTFDPDVYASPGICLKGYGSATLQVLGQTYTNQAWLWNDGYGAGGGFCGGGGNEVVVPSWGSGGPQLPDGWSPFTFGGNYFPGLYWGIDLSWTMPSSISPAFPYFYNYERYAPLTFVADLQAVPEPSTWLLLGTGLAAVAARRLGLMRRR